jgi:hypothetical protein
MTTRQPGGRPLRPPVGLRLATPPADRGGRRPTDGPVDGLANGQAGGRPWVLECPTRPHLHPTDVRTLDNPSNKKQAQQENKMEKR